MVEMKRLSDITITEAYEALQKVMRFEEQLEEENSNIEKLQLFRRRLYDYGKMYENAKKQVSLDRYTVKPDITKLGYNEFGL